MAMTMMVIHVVYISSGVDAVGVEWGGEIQCDTTTTLAYYLLLPIIRVHNFSELLSIAIIDILLDVRTDLT